MADPQTHLTLPYAGDDPILVVLVLVLHWSASGGASTSVGWWVKMKFGSGRRRRTNTLTQGMRSRLAQS
jgi:hypothetical protein